MREDTTRSFRPPLLPRAFVSLAKSHARGKPRPYLCFEAENGQNEPIERTFKASLDDSFW